METTAENDARRESPFRTLGRFLCWAAVVFLIYVASAGPLIMLYDKAGTQQSAPEFVAILYRPIGWMYENTPAQMPMGMYFHLWDPVDFDACGKCHAMK